MGRRYDENKIKQQIIDIVVNKVTPIVFDDMTQQYNKVISEFYDDYSPTVYDRTGSLFKASNSYSSNMMQTLKNCVTTTPNGFEVKLVIDPENIPGEPYSSIYGGVANKSEVFENSFIYGSHGNKLPGYTPVITTPPPKEAMDKWFENYKGTFGKLFSVAYKEAFNKVVRDVIFKKLKLN